jgi:glyoxylase-like metal-dependent hydrolase (beta-lactamase superfamily II)
MIYEIGKGTGVYCIEGAGARAYFVARPEPMLVDTGSPGHAEMLLRDLAHIGVQAIHLKKIVLTHHHSGHVGGLAFIKRKSGAPVFAHGGDVPYIAGHVKRRAPRRPVERVFQSAVSWVGFADPAPVAVERRVEDADLINGWRVIHTPGHTPGHICLLRGEMLISGDLLLASAGGFREMPLTSIADLSTARNSIRRVASLSFNAILPGHNPPHVFDASTRVQELVARWPGA